MKKIVLITSILFAIFSCKGDQLRVDGTDQIVFSQTVDEVAKSLPLLQQEKFKEALDIIYHYRTNPTNTEEERWSAVRNLVDDKNADEIFEMAESIAAQNNFLWNRNQVPLVNGIPLPTATNEKPVEEEQSSTNIQRFDFRITNEEDGFRIDPFFFDAEGKEVHPNEVINATIEVFNSGAIVYNKRIPIDPNSIDALYRNNGIFIKFSNLDKSKIKTDAVDVLVRIPHPDRYLTQRKVVELPTSFIGNVGPINDSISKELSKDAAMIVALSNRFIQNISKKNYSAAYALTRSNDWSTYQKFSSDNFVTSLADSRVQETKILDGDEKVILAESNITLPDNSSKKFIIKLENLNNKWFIVDID